MLTYVLVGATPIVLTVVIMVWAGGMWRDLPLLRRLDRGQDRGRRNGGATARLERGER